MVARVSLEYSKGYIARKKYFLSSLERYRPAELCCRIAAAIFSDDYDYQQVLMFSNFVLNFKTSLSTDNRLRT